MRIKRRTFLQQASLALLTLGVGNVGGNKQAWAAPLFDRYLGTLAQPTARKLALLVGVNEYSNGTNLSGCATDVELQRELLINRFGFNHRDILTLTGQRATRENIEAAFAEHLSEQAAADDVVVFHFSGYGSKVQVPQTGVSSSAEPAPSTANEVKASSAPPAYRLANSLVPKDGVLSAGDTANDLLEETLLLLAQRLATDKLTIVLDTSYKSTQQMLLGNLRVRSFPKRVAPRLNPEALAVQALLRQTNSARLKQSKPSIAGMILAAAADDQIATEGIWHGASAGVFTYALTQSLWQATPASTVLISMRGTAEQVERLTNNQQQPQLRGGSKQPLFTYYQIPETLTGAEGVITAIEDKLTAQILLAGLPGAVVENYGNSCFTLVVPPDLEAASSQGLATKPQVPSGLVLQMRSQEGLKAKARLIAEDLPPQFSLQPGQLVREKIRVLPRNVGLTVALDHDLERIERVDATSAFSSIDVVPSVVTAGEQTADCLFGRFKEDGATTNSGYGLFSVAGVPLANTTGKASEAVKLAVKRLAPELETQLAAKLWRLTNNEGSSGLRVRATLRTVEPKGQNRTIVRRETLRQSDPQMRYKALPSSADKSQRVVSNRNQPLATVASSTEIQYLLENQGDRPLYLMLLGLDSSGNAIALYSPKEQEETSANGNKYQLRDRQINPGETLTVPQPGISINWVVAGAAGIAEIQLIFSQAPFSKTLKMLSARPHLRDKEQALEIPNPLEVARALLQDLDAASQVSSDLVVAKEDNYAFDVNTWAGLSFIYQVV